MYNIFLYSLIVFQVYSKTSLSNLVMVFFFYIYIKNYHIFTKKYLSKLNVYLIEQITSSVIRLQLSKGSFLLFYSIFFQSSLIFKSNFWLSSNSYCVLHFILFNILSIMFKVSLFYRRIQIMLFLFFRKQSSLFSKWMFIFISLDSLDLIELFTFYN